MYVLVAELASLSVCLSVSFVCVCVRARHAFARCASLSICSSGLY
jgi:hypothetical protein